MKMTKFLIMVLILILHSYSIFMMTRGLTPLNYFNDVAIIIKDSTDTLGYFPSLFFGYINFVTYMSPFLFKEDVLLKELNDKYGQLHLISGLFIFEIVYILICHWIGYSLIINFSTEQCTFYSIRTFTVGVGFSLSLPSIILFGILTYKYLLPYFLGPLLEPFYDEQYGE